MVIFSRLGEFGRFGNQIFQIFGTFAIAEANDLPAGFPEWPYKKYFPHLVLPGLPMDINDKVIINESMFPFHEVTLDRSRINDLQGYFQTEKYFSTYKNHVKHALTFEYGFMQGVLQKHPVTENKRYCAVHVRRTDYVNNSCYYNAPLSYYREAMKQMPAGEVFRIFSDDIAYCKKIFRQLESLYTIEYIECNTDIEDFALMTRCKDFIIANSSFSWWAAWLAEVEDSIVIATPEWFIGDFRKQNQDHDIIPERWKRPPFERKKIDLRDVTFTIPVKYDHYDRKENLDLNICYLQHNFDCKIIVGEFDDQKYFNYTEKFCKYFFEKANGREFHRTWLLNKMAELAETPIVVNWDADIFIDPEQILAAVQKIRNGEADGCYPYDGRFYRVNRDKFQLIQKDLNVNSVIDLDYPKYMHEQESYGGAIIWNVQKFIEGGAENEKMIHWGPEDYERYERFAKLGYKIERVHGGLYHINHYTSPATREGHKHFKENEQEYDRIKSLPVDRLKDEVDQWEWVLRMKKNLKPVTAYTTDFYNDINEGSMVAADIILPILKEIIPFKTVLDVGCGTGAWGLSFAPEDYTGVDGEYVREESLLIDKKQFIAKDLSKKINLHKQFDLVISLEVGEHIDPACVDTYIDNLCRHGKTILFSAAIPHQGGNNHVNEQWPSYWIKKFNEKGYHTYDIIRSFIWDNQDIPYYYRQNIFVFSKKKIDVQNAYMYDIVHPEKYLEAAKR